MNKKDKTQLAIKCRQEILDHGAIATKQENEFILPTKIGKAEIKLDLENKVMSLFINFVEHPIAAKLIFTRWKKNIHLVENPNFDQSVMHHIHDIKDRIAEYFRPLTLLNAFERTQINSTIERCYGLADLILEQNGKTIKNNVYTILAEQTGLRKEFLLRNEIEVLMLAQNYINNLLKAHSRNP